MDEKVGERLASGRGENSCAAAHAINRRIRFGVVRKYTRLGNDSSNVCAKAC